MLKNVLSLSFIVASRFFGLFLILPVISTEGVKLSGATTHNVGLLVGVYAISQMIFQVPFGALSDRFGRKFAMSLGLVVFIIGSIICAFSQSFSWMLAGRLLQGSGAIGGVASAMIADLTTPAKRSQAMALTGILVGVSFCAAMALASVLNAKFGFAFLFHFSTFLSLLCLVMLYFVPNPPQVKAKKSEFNLAFLLNLNLMILNLSSFLQKMFLSAAMVAIPLVYIAHEALTPEEVKALGFNAQLQTAYILGACGGFVAMAFAGALGDRLRLNKAFVVVGIVIFAASFYLLRTPYIFVGAVLFFVAFCLHEPSMQTLASKFAPPQSRGAAMSVFVSGGYAGSFVGGALSSFVVGEFGAGLFFGVMFWLTVVWGALSLFLKREPKISSKGE